MSVTPVFCELKVSSNCLHSNITKRKNPYLRVEVSVLTKGFHVTILPFGGSCVLFFSVFVLLFLTLFCFAQFHCAMHCICCLSMCYTDDYITYLA